MFCASEKGQYQITKVANDPSVNLTEGMAASGHKSVNPHMQCIRLDATSEQRRIKAMRDKDIGNEKFGLPSISYKVTIKHIKSCLSSLIYFYLL